MKKKVLALVLAGAAAVGCLTGCFAEQPGCPTPSAGADDVWQETVSDANAIPLGSMEACAISNDLELRMELTAQRFTVQDLEMMKQYLVQLDRYRPEDTDEGRYFAKVREIFRSLYGIYTGSCETALLLTRQQELQAMHEALPTAIRNELALPPAEMLQAAADRIYALAEERLP